MRKAIVQKYRPFVDVIFKHCNVCIHMNVSFVFNEFSIAVLSLSKIEKFNWTFWGQKKSQ